MKEKFFRFISGRYIMYGLDRLSWFLLAAYLIFSVSVEFITDYRVRLAVKLFAASLAVYMIFRLLSKNHYARRKENAVVIKFCNKTSAFFKLQFNRIKNIKTTRYRTCPHCKAILCLPVPKKKGKNSVVCPKCGKRFSVFNLF